MWKLYGILEYRRLETSKLLAEKAQASALNMEDMTREMHEIARKTKQETVSMRIITLVTLFFLPGTFISVSHTTIYLNLPNVRFKTLMSTGIVQFGTSATGASERTVQVGALQLFLALSLPLMLLTFVAWYFVYWWINRKEERKTGGTTQALHV